MHTSFWAAQLQSIIGSNWQFESQTALTSSKIVFKVYNITIVPCSRRDFAMSSGERDSLYLGFPYLICFESVCLNSSAKAGQNVM